MKILDKVKIGDTDVTNYKMLNDNGRLVIAESVRKCDGEVPETTVTYYDVLCRPIDNNLDIERLAELYMAETEGV